MTHVADADKECGRRSKGDTLCGKEISIRKLVTNGSTCPECFALDFVNVEALMKSLDSIGRYVEICMDRWGLIRARRAFNRRRWRK